MKKLGNVKAWLAKQVFKLFAKELLTIYYLGLKPKKGLPKDKISFAFFAKSGKQYYTALDLPILRKMHVAQAYVRLVNAIDETDISVSIDRILEALHNKDAKGKMQPDIAMIGFICQKLKQRKGYYVREDLIHDLMANYFIREDETYDEVNQNILAEKIADMKELPHSIVSDFFYSKSVNELFPYIQNSKLLLAEITKETAIETDAFLKLMQNGG